MMYSYNNFIIRQTSNSFPMYVIYENEIPYSVLRFKNAEKAKQILDKVFPYDENEKLIRVFTICGCGCGKQILENKTGQKKFIEGHNDYNHYKNK